MPGGVAPAVVLDPSGAALLAAKILGLVDPAILERIEELQQNNRDKITTDDAELV
jgi:phosphoribosylcarboxyaminoimidazole (NCAIR) mutase